VLEVEQEEPAVEHYFEMAPEVGWKEAVAHEKAEGALEKEVQVVAREV
jgi:hypothetical protein